jgi:hypothetical protein
MARRANIQGIPVGSTQMFEAMNRAIAANRMKLAIDKVFGFDNAKAAYRTWPPAHTSARSSSAWRRDPRGGSATRTSKPTTGASRRRNSSSTNLEILC